ncbi:MAG: L-threonylcarbamoyladenylate synthase [Candidatus Nomurabacteria bacterium]|nr:L-threonylcarbamoyladenylate synthase [Candidatus Nomurabacteria bacterium]
MNIWNNENLIKVLRENGVVVMPTDTLYGIVGKAENVSVVNRIYEARKRSPDKPCIILIGDMNELEKFSVILSEKQKEELKKYWPFDFAQDLRPEPTSIIFDCPDEPFSYLHRGTKTLAFRLPANQELRDLLKKTGPLLAPSANLEAKPPSETIAEAKKYFGNKVDIYIDGGTVKGKASKVIRLHKNGSVEVLR